MQGEDSAGAPALAELLEPFTGSQKHLLQGHFHHSPVWQGYIQHMTPSGGIQLVQSISLERNLALHMSLMSIVGCCPLKFSAA